MDEFCLFDRSLFRVYHVCIPRYALRLLFVKESHMGALMGYFGRDKTYELLCIQFYRPHVLNGWKGKLYYVEPTYSRIVHPSTNNPLTPLDLKPFPMGERAEFDAGNQVEFMKKLHETTRARLLEKGLANAEKVSQHRKEEYGVSPDINVGDLTPFEGEDFVDSRSNPFQEGEVDAGASGVDTISVVEGAITRSRAKEIQRDFTKFVLCTMKKGFDPDETKMEMDESHVTLVSNSSY